MTKAKFVILTIMTFGILTIISNSYEPRIWTRSDGKKAAGTLVEFKNEEVTIKFGESEIIIKLQDLSPEDRAYLLAIASPQKAESDRLIDKQSDSGVSKKFTDIDEEKVLFEIKLTHSGNHCWCHVFINNELPKPEDVDKIVRSALESAIIISPNKNIWATACRNDDVGTTLKTTEYSGTLVYESKEKRIVTASEHSGEKISVIDSENYYMQIVESKTLAGIKPERKWLSISIVFPIQPEIDKAAAIAIAEIEKRVALGIDINLYLRVGDKKNKFSWQQIKNSDQPGYVWFSYDSLKRTISGGSKLIKVVP